jgi:hypothetical protein
MRSLKPPGSRTIEANMQPAFSMPFPEPLPAAMPQLKEKPRHGVRSWNPAPHPGQFFCNSRTAIGLQFGWSGIVSGTVDAPNNGECDNACQLAHAFNKTGVYTLTSPCFVPAFYAASGTAAAGGVAVANYAEIEAATAGNYATWYGRAISWLNRVVGRTPLGPPVSAMAATAAGQVSQFCNSH